jgi:hypothetical protein
MQPHASLMLDYYVERNVSVQWRGFLTALAEEFNDQLDVAELRALMRHIGERFASHAPLPGSNPGSDTIDALQDAINALWDPLDWGRIELVEHADHLLLTHYCAPLNAFGDAGARWAPAFLEGVYRNWFGALGAEGLQLKQVEAAGADGTVEGISARVFLFRLAR